jgi:hypothetical protein
MQRFQGRRSTSSSQDSQAPDPLHSGEASKRQRLSLTASCSVHLNQFEDFDEDKDQLDQEEEEVGDQGSSSGTSQRASGRVPGATLPSGNPPSPSGRSANAPGSGLASDSCIQVETDQERKARRRRELHFQKRDSIIGKDAVVSPVAPRPGIIERRTTGGGNDTKGRKTKIVGFNPWEQLKAIFVGLATFIAMGTMGQNFQSSFHKQVMAEALKAAIDVVATPGSELERHGGASGFSDDCKKNPAPAGVFFERYEQLCRTNASVRMNVVYFVFRGVLLS